MLPALQLLTIHLHYPSKYTPASTNLSAITGYNLNVNGSFVKIPSVWKTDLLLIIKFQKQMALWHQWNLFTAKTLTHYIIMMQTSETSR